VGLSWQQGPLSPEAIGRFLVSDPLPKLLYVEPIRRRMRVRFGGTWIADSEHALALFEPGRYLVAYFPEADVSADALQRSEYTTQHPDLGLTAWYAVRAGEHSAARGGCSILLCPRMHGSSRRGLRSPGGPWTVSLKKTNVCSVTPRTPTTASPSGGLAGISKFTMEAASSPTPRDRWCSTNRGSRRDGT
jgi:hypothetical protein